jgi:predicted Zn-dependent protease
MKNLYKILTLLLTLIISTSYIGLKSHSKEISIVVIGEFPKKDVEFVQKKLKKFYNCKVNILPKMDIPVSCKVNGLRKYSSVKIVKLLNSKFKNVEGKVVALTQVDICTDRKLNGKTFKNWGVIGLSLKGTKSCVVSNKRMMTNYYGKLEKVSIHEIGHCLDIPHCETHSKCLMNDAKGNGSKIDKELLWICDDCKNKIKY